MRSKGLDELLGRRGVTAAHHDRAVQVRSVEDIVDVSSARRRLVGPVHLVESLAEFDADV